MIIRVSSEGEVARVVLARPERLNALSPELLRHLIAACEEIGRDESVKVVALTGDGLNFSAGADLPAFGSELESSPHETADLGRMACEALAALPQVTLAIIRGHCVGGGLVLAAACDIRICADDSRFAIPELEVGIPLAWGGMAHLVRLIGETVAADLVLTGRPFNADEALELGFVSRVVAAEHLDAEASDLINTIAGKARLPLHTTKQQLRALRTGTFEPSDDAASLLACFADPEASRSLRAAIDRLS